MQSRKEYLTNKYEFKAERLNENKAGNEDRTDKQANFIYSLAAKNDKNSEAVKEMMEMFSLYGLLDTIETLSKSQAMYMLNKLLK